jgi:hypothetical protein
MPGTEKENSPEQPADGAGTAGGASAVGLFLPRNGASRGAADRRRCPGGRGSRRGGRGGPSGRCQVGQGGRGRTLSVSSLAPNAPQIWGRFGEKWAVRGEDTGLGAALGAVFGQRCPFGQKGADGEDLGPALEMLLPSPSTESDPAHTKTLAPPGTSRQPPLDMVAPPISSEAKMWPVGVTSSHVRGIVLSGGLEGLSVVEAVRDEASQ